MFDLKGKVALISGGSRGQGEAEARLFTELGAAVVIGDIRDALGEEVASQTGATYVHLDVSVPGDWQAAVALTLARYGKLDILINNAGFFSAGLVETQPLDEYLQLIKVNQIGCFLGMQAVVPAMRAAGGGSIVNVGSSASVMAAPGPAIAYTSTKFALRGMTKSAAIELGRNAIRVNLLIPGAMATPMTTEDEIVLAANRNITRRQPIARMGEALECAQMAAFLASDASRFCTGGDFAVDGGFTAGHLLSGDG